MCRAEEELKAILDQLAQWRKRHGIGYVTMHIGEDGRGGAFTRHGKGRYDVYGVYDPYKENAPTAATDGAKTINKSRS